MSLGIQSYSFIEGSRQTIQNKAENQQQTENFLALMKEKLNANSQLRDISVKKDDDEDFFIKRKKRQEEFAELQEKEWKKDMLLKYQILKKQMGSEDGVYLAGIPASVLLAGLG